MTVVRGVRGVCLAVSATVLLTLVAVGIVRPAQADARIATGGVGRFGGAIDWVEWGTPGQPIPTTGAYTRSSTTSIGGVDLVVTCSLANVTGPQPQAYRPGTSDGDAMDDLYNVGGANAANTFVNAVKTTGTVTFGISCTATLGGRPFKLSGLVFGDAEQSSAPSEHVQAAIPSSATWRIIDRFRTPGCTQPAHATRTDNGAADTLLLTGSAPLCKTGPAAIAFADGATSVTITAVGESAVALGVVVAFDGGDAPAGYGDAAHVLQYPFAGGELPVGGSNGVSEPFALASVDQPSPRLGISVDPGGSPSPDAEGDDVAGGEGAFGAADDETADPPASISVTRNQIYTQTGIACSGPGTVAAWIDFNASGTFDAAERSQNTLCIGESVALTWEVPGDMQPQKRSFMRVRIAVAPGDVANPTGLASTGEVEDHALAINRPAPAAPATRPSGTAILPLTCSGRSIALLDVHRANDRVEVSGLARTAYRGRRASIRALGTQSHGTATIQPDGSFRTTLRLQSRRLRAQARYQATVAGRRSEPVKLARRLTIVSRRASAAGTRVTVQLSHAKRHQAVTIRRQLTCTRYTRLATIRTTRGGRFTVTLPPPAAPDPIAYYRATTKLDRGRTFTLPIAVRATTTPAASAARRRQR
jgi:hypothetical protein